MRLDISDDDFQGRVAALKQRVIITEQRSQFLRAMLAMVAERLDDDQREQFQRIFDIFIRTQLDHAQPSGTKQVDGAHRLDVGKGTGQSVIENLILSGEIDFVRSVFDRHQA